MRGFTVLVADADIAQEPGQLTDVVKLLFHLSPPGGSLMSEGYVDGMVDSVSESASGKIS